MGEVTDITFNGVRQVRRVHEGRVVDGPDLRDGSQRGTFSGGPDAYPGDNASQAQIAAWMAEQAQKRGLPPQLPSERIKLIHDAPIAHAGALGGRPGVVIIAGTGSVIYARDSPRCRPRSPSSCSTPARAARSSA